MSDLLSLSAVEARKALDKGDVSATELTSAYLEAVEATSSLNNYVAVTAEHAIEMAKASETRIRAGEAGLIEGIPVGVKDLFCTAGFASTACSRILQGFTPTYESTVTANLWREGGVMLGKINCDEFAMGSANETSAFGAAVNPWQGPDGVDLVPGDPPVVRLPPSRRVRRFLRQEPILVARPAARGLLWCRRHEADLWPLFALGHRRLRQFARSGWSVQPDRGRQRPDDAGHGQP